MSSQYFYYQKRKLDPFFWLLLITFFKLILCVIDFFLDRIFGISVLYGNRHEREKLSRSYEKSAHILRIVSRGTINLFHPHDESNFLYIHDSYAHPNYILENENVVLKTVTQKSAIFVVSDKNVSAYDSEVGPFLCANTFIVAKYLVILPLTSFVKLSQEAGDPIKKHNLKITFIHMTTRCGSTLLGRFHKNLHVSFVYIYSLTR